MTASWVSLLSTLVPLALVVSISPLSVIPAVLVLQTPRPRPTGLAFLAGWLVGLIALTAGFIASSDALTGLHDKPPLWASWTRVVLGLALIAFGIYRWLHRGGHSESPKWMRSFETLTPPRAAVFGAVLTVVRIEVLTMCALAGLAIGSGKLGRTGELVTGAIYIAVAASTVAIPVLAYAAAGNRLDDPMARLKEWMERNNAAMLAAVLVLIGGMVLYHGVTALS
ncbi:GAP family protein [Candidatus Mycobacterium wuenschmannii]|uniref:GAP family protein n=1 Tax=Candidatus Mycobacterium wuenschmannii TaxID=3027808 RepID=A0ABY8VU72_9MYCO|nr:GAP family protein [Candidatus Mycobacterium wuenschmannii]WIM87163.1 GAP family protein [Candidatus Mycobacterium wuenschmannii]